MLRLDTIKIVTSYDNIRSIDTSDTRVTEDEKKQNKKVVGTKVFVGGAKDFGIHKSMIKNDCEYVFSMSAKVLLDDYTRGISIDTIEQALTNFNRVSPVELNIPEVIANSRFYSFDSTQMIYPDYELKKCCRSLLALRTNRKCKVSPYKTGIEFNSSIQKEKRRLIIYDKYAELFGKKSARAFLTNCKNPLQLMKNCKGALRVEQSNTSKDSIKKRFNLADTSLLSVLNSSENANYNYLDSVMQESRQLDLFLDSYGDAKLNDIIKLEGIKGIVRQLDYDIDMIRNFLDAKLTRTVKYKYFKVFEDVLNGLMAEELKESLGTSTSDINSHILELIKTSN